MSEFSVAPQVEQEELRKIEEAQEKVFVLIEKYREQLKKAEEELKQVQKGVKMEVE